MKQKASAGNLTEHTARENAGQAIGRRSRELRGLDFGTGLWTNGGAVMSTTHVEDLFARRC